MSKTRSQLLALAQLAFANGALAAALSLAACGPGDPRAAAGTWPPEDYAAFARRAPMSVGAELDDAWTMAIEAERWSYQIGVAIVAVGGTPPAGAAKVPSADYLARADRALRHAAARLVALQALTCGSPAIAKAEDCAAFAAPAWVAADADAPTPPKDDVQARLQWFQISALQFVLPACSVAIKRTGDQRFCAVE